MTSQAQSLSGSATSGVGEDGNVSLGLVEGTLSLDNSTSLTLSPQSLIIRGHQTSKKGGKSSEKVARHSVTLDASAYSEPVGSSTTRAIPLYNILWASHAESVLTITYAQQASKTTVKPATLSFPIESVEEVEPWIAKLLDRAYGKAQRAKRIRVLVNPKAGPGGAEKKYVSEAAPILKAANCHIHLTTTKYRGEAIEITKDLDLSAYDVIVVCSGDGLVHEVFNGLGKRPDARKALQLPVSHIPCGSGNGMSSNLNGNNIGISMAALAIVKGIRAPLDLMSVTQGDTRILSFLSQAAGIAAEADLATENLRWMGGTLRFTYGYLVRSMLKRFYPCDLAIKVAIGDKDKIREHWREYESKATANGVANSATSEANEGLPPLKYGTVKDKIPDDWELVQADKMGNFYTGNMAYMATDAHFFPAALPNDGMMDLFCIDGDISRVAAVKQLVAVEHGNFFSLPHVTYKKVLAYRLIPKAQPDGYISIDGEPVPFEPFQVEIHKGLGTVLSKTGHMYEAPGPK